MKLVVIGYQTCEYYIDITDKLGQAAIEFDTIIAKDHQDLMFKVYKLGFNKKLAGVYGSTSPQVFFKLNKDVLWCLGGHDDTIRFGIIKIKEMIENDKKHEQIKY